MAVLTNSIIILSFLLLQMYANAEVLNFFTFIFFKPIIYSNALLLNRLHCFLLYLLGAPITPM